MMKSRVSSIFQYSGRLHVECPHQSWSRDILAGKDIESFHDAEHSI